jgi:protein-S-isoprenylcysteine O-methyltransferase Ste14
MHLMMKSSIVAVVSVGLYGIILYIASSHTKEKSNARNMRIGGGVLLFAILSSLAYVCTRDHPKSIYDTQRGISQTLNPFGQQSGGLDYGDFASMLGGE